MEFSRLGNNYYRGDAAIGDHWLQVSPKGHAPVLSFRAPAHGRYRFALEAAARFIGGPPVVLSILAGVVPILELHLSSPAPIRRMFEHRLNAGEEVRFIAEATPAGMQRAICIVNVDRI